jgi:radical SAM protein with 4Fe4S-binding SPASM domain
MQSSIKHIRYLNNFLRRRLVHLNLQLLYQCNFRCRICDFWQEEYAQAPKLSVEDMRIIVEKLRPLSPLIVSLGGGEPMILRDLTEIIRLLAQEHFPVMICNGWYMTPERARGMFEAGLYEISISVDYADPAKHDEQRGVDGAFDRAIRALEMLQRSRTKPAQRVHMITVVMEDNIDQIEPLIKLAKEIGVTYLVTMYSDGRGKKLNRDSQLDISRHLLELRKRHNNFVAIRGYLSQFTQAMNVGVSPCFAGKNLFNIDCQGNVTRCIDRLDQVAGNIFEDDIFSIQQALLDQYEAEDCSDCWTSCRGNFETLMYGRQRWQNLIDGYRITKDIPLSRT